MSTKPLLKTLTEAGIGSRRRLADAIKSGMVTVNGRVAEDFRQPVDLKTDRVCLNGRQIDIRPAATVYLMLHKPRGVLSTTNDERGRRTVLDTLPPEYRQLRLYPVGRLDRDSTGLLLLTNDGNATHRLTHPRFEHEKEYLIQIDGRLSPEEKRQLERGIKLEDGMTHPALVKAITNTPPFNYSLTIHEGRKRQVRRMLASLGHHVLALKRIRMGSLRLANLKEGKTRQLRPQEVALLLSDQ